MWLSLWGGGGVHWGQICGASGGLSWCVPSLCPLACLTPASLCLNMPLFCVLRGFWRGFSCSVWVCLAWVLCVDCGAFYVRVRLGGFGACGVFCLSFSSFLLLSSLFLLSSCSCPASLLGFCSWSLGLLVLWLLFPFPFRMYRQKERAQFLASSLRGLWVFSTV